MLTSGSNADAPTFSPAHNETLFTKPHEEEQEFSAFLEYVVQQEKSPLSRTHSEVRYAQTRQSTASVPAV